jgi:hypothetical protein
VKRGAILLFALALAALGAPACGKKDEPKPTAASGSAPAAGSDMAGSAAGSAATGSAAGSAAAGSAAGSAAAEVEVPTEADFEADAAAKINEKNLEAQLKAVEQELAR